MRLRWMLLPIVALVALGLLAAACGDDDGGAPAASSSDDTGAADTGPSSSGAVAPDVFMTFDGERYRLTEVLQADLISEDFSEIGVASEADIDHDGDLKVYSRDGDGAAVYTFSPAVDGDGEEGDVPATWGKWEPDS